MLKYFDVAETLSEFPDEIALCINITQCPCKCENCSEPWLQKDQGTELTKDKLVELVEKHPYCSCIGFMGGDINHEEIKELAIEKGFVSSIILVEVVNPAETFTMKFLYNGEVRTCNCGSGFDKEERDMFFKNPELIIGKVIEINYFEVTKDSKTGTESLRFGTYQHRIREDKTAEDITDVAL